MTATHVLIVEGDTVWFSSTPATPDFGAQLLPRKPMAMGLIQVELVRPKLFGHVRVRVSEHRPSLIVSGFTFTGYRFDIRLDHDGWYYFNRGGVIERNSRAAPRLRLVS